MSADSDPRAPKAGARLAEIEGPLSAGAPVNLARGVAVLIQEVERLPDRPGVYRMLDAAGDVLYVGKAKSLKKRVASYTHPDRLTNRIRRMVAETHALELIITHTEVEALLLESNLIKKLNPRYNILLRDDKTYPYILLTGDHEFPQVIKHRGARARTGDYFGPFASTVAVNRTIIALQKAFLLRNCSDAIFSARTRPCLQFQIKRCAAPCVGRASAEEYRALVDAARRFLKGGSRAIQADLAEQMQAASDRLDFETAARLRDRLRGLAHVTAHQDINIEGLEDADVIAAHQAGGQTCIEVFIFRGGGNFGNRAYFPRHDQTISLADVLAAFLGQYYAEHLPPPEILLSHPIDEPDLVADALSIRAERRVRLAVPQRGPKRQIVEHAETNAREALGRRLAERGAQAALLSGVAELFDLPAPPQRIEVYDNSHIQGTNAQGAMIVAGPDGFIKGAYRRWTIKERPGDDFAMMREVFTRRFGRALKESPDRAAPDWPGLVLIDGGLGQLNAAREIMAELGLDDIPLVGIAKGPDRDAGRERFFLPDADPFQLPPNDPVLYFLQRLRDEAHRFAIGGHRAKRTREMGASELDEIPGIGAKRKKALLHHFGSARAVRVAGLADLEAVPGIDKMVARRIFEHFQSG